jgi:formate hydrogenlyase subunit 3/multisubunit Na+/H+ antiporter MnhD subunit
LLPLATVPALLLVAMTPVGTRVSLPWLLLGSELGIDEPSRLFLGFSSLLWLVASVYLGWGRDTVSASYRFRIFFLLAMSGNFALIVAQDMVTFYLGFALMGLSAYGLVAEPVHRRARRAANRYLAWTIAGELLLFTAVVLLAAGSTGTLTFEALQDVPRSPFVALLLVAGFGIKLALPLLHWWLPPVYATTPVVAVALFSGVMIKAGVLGWLRFLPPGAATPAGLGTSMMWIGAATILFGVIAGLLQTRPRLLLGYSSISKMGVLATGLGAALSFPAAASGIIAALLLYTAHHAFVKTALFLGLGLLERGGLRPWLLTVLGFLALALAGAPFTTGALAKSGFGDSVLPAAPELVTLLAASSLATMLLMVRFIALLATRRRRKIVALPPVPIAAWLCLVALVAIAPFALADVGRLMTNAVPVALGLVLGLVMLPILPRLSRSLAGVYRRSAANVSSPDVRVALGQAVSRTHGGIQCWITFAAHTITAQQRRAGAWLARLQRNGGADPGPLTGVLWLIIAASLLVTFTAT